MDGGKKLKNLIVYLEPANAETARAAARQTVTQKNRIFKPGVSVIVASGTVSFVNDEDKEIDHNVYSLSKTRKFDIGLAPRGSTLTVDFPQPGTVKYYCSVHKNMQGVIVVLPSPFYAIMTEPGDFTIENVPPGDWKLSASVSHRRYTVTPVDLAVTDNKLDSLILQVSKKKRK